MKKLLRGLVGALSLWPIVYLVFFFTTIVVSFGNSGGMIVPFDLLFGLHLATMGLAFALLVFYVWHAATNPSVTKEWRIIWILLLIHGGPIAMPVYWARYVWPGRLAPYEEGALSGATP